MRPSLADDLPNDVVVALAIRAPEEMIAILELISSVVVAIPTDYTLSFAYEDGARDCQLSERRRRSNTVVINQVRRTASRHKSG